MIWFPILCIISLCSIVILWGDNMANHITLYNYSGENNRVGKTLSGGSSFTTVVFRDSIDFHNPVFPIESDVSPAYNYAEVEQDGTTRYYFARVENVRRGLSLIHCSLDVLQTFDLSAVPVVPARSENRYNAWLIDTRRPIETTVQHYNVPFSGDNLDYANMSLIAGIVGTGGEPTNI